MIELKTQTARLDVSYRIHEETHVLDVTEAYENSDLKIDWRLSQHHDATFLKVTLSPKTSLELFRMSLSMDQDYHKDQRLFVNGYQSWTDSHEHAIDDRLQQLSPLAKRLNDKYQFSKYGDYEFYPAHKGKGYFHGYTYAYIRNRDELTLMGSLNESDGFTIFELQVPKKKMNILKDVDGVVLDHPISLDLFFETGQDDAVFDAYFEALGIKKVAQPKRMGWTSWYNYYQGITETIILENLKAASELSPKMDVFQIDDGYQTAVGDWLSVDPVKFPNGMKPIAQAIQAQGSLAGIWMAPLVAQCDSQLVKDHFDWVLKDAQGNPEMAGSGWGGFYALDLENPEVKAYIKACFDVVLNEWGFDLVKLDFLYAAALGHHPTKTRGQRSAEAMAFLRECVKDKLILGCGVPLGSAFGKVEYCRIGPDVSLDWKGNWYAKLIHRERVSTHNAILNAIGRRHLDQRAFLNDPDVFLLRTTNIQMSPSQKDVLAEVNRLFGSLLFTSDLISDYDPSQKAQLIKTYGLTDKTILSVTYPQKDGVMVSYLEAGKPHLAYLNLGSKRLNFEQGIRLQPYSILILDR